VNSILKKSNLKYLGLQYCALALYYISTLMVSYYLKVSDSAANPLSLARDAIVIVIGALLLSSFFTLDKVNMSIILVNIIVLICLSLFIYIKPMMFASSSQFLFLISILIGMNLYYLLKKENRL
jgi:hypothetical protein